MTAFGDSGTDGGPVAALVAYVVDRMDVPGDVSARDAAVLAAEVMARMVNDAPDAILVTDLDGTIIWANSATERVIGWSPCRLIGRPVSVLAPPEAVGEPPYRIRRLATGAPVAPFVERMARYDGSRVEVSVVLSPLHDLQDRTIGAVAVLREMTDVRRVEHRLARQESLFLALSRRASDVSLISDAEGNIVFVSPSAADVLGYGQDEGVGLAGWGFIHPDDVPIAKALLERVLATPDRVDRATFRVRHKDGSWRWMEETLTNCVDVPEVGGIVANLRDVTAEVEAARELEISEARYRAIVETAQEGMLVVSRDGQVVFANEKLAEIVGLPRENIYKGELESPLPAATAADLRRRLGARSADGPEQYELAYPHPDGGVRLLSVASSPLRLDDEGTTGSLAMISDVTDARRAEEELRTRALHDALTGLPNRTLLADRLEMALARQTTRDADGAVALLFLDLDQFKLVNDAAGHDAGDALLVEVAHRLRDAVRPGDTVARFGGDEFVVLCEGVDEEVATQLAERLRTALATPVRLGAQRHYIDGSVGIALSPPHPPESLLQAADAAMYQAKNEGRGRVRVFDSLLADTVDRRLQVCTALREALTKDDLDLHYQPVVDLASGRTVGVEALLRWTHEDLGAVSPPEVVAAAESIGLAYALDAWVLRRACADLARLGRADLTLSVNLSARSVDSRALVGLVAEVTEETGWPTSRLVLEVTESAIMDDPVSAAEVLADICALGVAVAVDDFGTGYSSLAYLKRLPVSSLKVDRSFVEHVTDDPDSRAIARSIVDLARALGLRTIAEGIETEAQAAAMSGMGCALGQGYLWSPAVPPEDLPPPG